MPSTVLAVRGLERRGDGVLPGDEALHGGAGAEDDALLGEGLVRKPRDLLVLRRQDAVEHLDHRHLRAEGAVEACELDADSARADDEQRPREVFRNHRLLVGPDQSAVGLEPGKGPRPRAGGDDDMLGTDRRQRFTVLAGERDAALTFEPRRSVDHGDVVLLHEKGDAVRQALGHFAAALDHLREIEADIVGAQAELARVLHQAIDLGGA